MSLANASFDVFIRTLTARFVKRLGIDYPAAVQAALDNEKTLMERADTFMTGAELIPATLAALEADRDPLEDPDVQRALNISALEHADIRRHIQAKAKDDVVTAIKNSMDDFTNILAPILDSAAGYIETGAEYIGSEDLDALDYSKLGPKAAAAAAGAASARTTINDIAEFWGALAKASRLTVGHRALIIADIPAADYIREHQDNPNLMQGTDAWKLRQAGYTLRLATRAEYIESVRAIEEAQPVADKHKTSDHAQSRVASIIKGAFS